MEKKFPELKNDAILKAARGETPHRVPVWIMRQAGRYLPEFRRLREDHDFFKIVRTPELATEITLQPIRRYDLDAAIIFSDILVLPQAIGMEVLMKSGTGPVFTDRLTTPGDVAKLNFSTDLATHPTTKGTLEAITLTRMKLDGKVPLLGFTGAPWTLMSYMIEGQGSKTFKDSRSWLYMYPKESESLLNQLAELAVQYLVLQVKAGAQMLQVFESHAEYLSPSLFKTYSLPFLSWIQKETQRRLKDENLPSVPMVVFAKGGHCGWYDLSCTDYDVIGLDWTISPDLARKNLRPNTVVQGNLDPTALYGDKDSIVASVKDMITKFGVKNYICNLGHGIYPDTPTDSVQSFIESVHSYQITG